MTNHQIRMVGEAENLATIEDDLTHIADPNCLCEGCSECGNVKECTNPHRCITKAQELINLLPPKCYPKTHTQLAAGEEMFDQDDPERNNRTAFDKKLVLNSTLNDTF